MSDDMYNVVTACTDSVQQGSQTVESNTLVPRRSNDKEVSTSLHNDVVSRRDLKYGPYFEPNDYVS